MEKPKDNERCSSLTASEDNIVHSPWEEILDELIVRHQNVDQGHSEALPCHIPHMKALEEFESDMELVEPPLGLPEKGRGGKNLSEINSTHSTTFQIQQSHHSLQSCKSIMQNVASKTTKPSSLSNNFLRKFDLKEIIAYVREKSDPGFWYMIFKHPKFSENYCPYKLQIVPYSKIDKNHFFTISHQGITEFSKSEILWTPLDVWEVEYELFDKLMQINIFKNMHFVLTYHWWRKNISLFKFYSTRKKLSKILFILNSHFRRALLKYHKICYPLRVITFIQFSGQIKFQLQDLISKQEQEVTQMYEKISSLQNYLKEFIINTCHSVLTTYAYTLNEGNHVTAGKVNCTSRSISYIDQAKKRSMYMRISCFIKLTDYFMMDFLRCVMYNSLNKLLTTLSKYSMNEFNEEEIPKSSTNQPETSEKISPIFDLNVLINADCIYFSPSKEKYLSSINMMLDKWAETVTNVQPLLSNELSDPFTSPIIDGRQEKRLCGMGPCLANVIINDEELYNLRKKIINILEHNFTLAYAHTEILGRIRIFYSENERTQHKDIEKETDPEFFKSLLENVLNQKSLLESIEDEQSIGIFMLKFENFKRVTQPSPGRLLESIHRVLPWIGKTKIDALTSEVTDAIAFLEISPRTTLDFVEYLEFLEKASTRIEEMEHELEYVKKIYSIIEDYAVPCPAEDVAIYLGFGTTLATLRSIIHEKSSEKGNFIERFNDQLNKDIVNLMEEVTDINDAVLQPMLIDINSNPEEVNLILTELDGKLQEINKRAIQFQNYQKVIKMEVTKYDILEEAMANVHLRQLLWENVEVWYAQLEEWSCQDFYTLNHENMMSITEKYLKFIDQLENDLPENLIVPKWRESVEKIKIKLPVIACLRNPDLKYRHWMKVEQVLGYKFNPDKALTLSLLDELNTFSKKCKLEEISGQASSEAALESILKKIEEAWKSLEFIVIPYKEAKDAYILGKLDEVQDCLDDCSMNINTVASSKHAGPMKQRVDDWIKNLDLFSKILDEWLSCQQGWLYLKPIFLTPDIQSLLPNESNMFLILDKSWKKIMRSVHKDPLAMQNFQKHELLETFQLNNNLVDQIIKCLESYLDSKRIMFPRFYFLSNNELLEILGQVKHPDGVQPHIRKFFNGIAKLEFGKNSPKNERSVISFEVVGMVSPERESVEFFKGVRARGNVEEWLSRVESTMLLSMKKRTKIAIDDFYLKDFQSDWIMSHPSQVVLTVSQIMWCQTVHAILESDNVEDKLISFEKKFLRDIDELVIMVHHDIPQLLRAVLSALIVIDVYARDIVANLVKNKIVSSSSFEWMKHLRYYWDEDFETVIVKMSNYKYDYGYEYLGASPRLVITPLTERCYLCLMGALQSGLGGAITGTTGAGKTETIKDLAKSFATNCVLFNCSKGLDHEMMGRFFSGIAQAGAWSCLDEFNRIDVEVLSVIAQQLLTIKNAKSQKLSRFIFEGRDIKLSLKCCTFITMSPGYAGKDDLPDNLKVLFRPMSMMVPDYAIIAEVILFSEGFEASKTLARKVTQIYKLCSGLLSQQNHYDFGMRAIKSVLAFAGLLKHENPDKSEDMVLIRALRVTNLPKLSSNDILLFKSILGDFFPNVLFNYEDNKSLYEAIKTVMSLKELQVNNIMVEKVIQLHETMSLHNGVVLVGPTGSGKTTLYEVLKSSLTKLFADNVIDHHFKPVQTYVLNPKAVSLNELYGGFDPVTHDWHDGILGKVTRTAAQSTDEIHHWIICDGPVDTLWIESMNSALDDEKILCLANFERIRLTPWIRLVFEVQDLSHASPSTVSRCGIVYMDAKETRWMPYFETWLSKIPDSSLTKPYLRDLVYKYVDEGLHFVQLHCTHQLDQVDLGKISTMCSILDWYIDEYLRLEDNMDSSTLRNFITQTFIFSYIWSVGGSLKETCQHKFEAYVREQFEKHPDARLPTHHDLWSYYMNTNTRQLDIWYKLMPNFVFDPAIPFFEVHIPTEDSVRYGYIIEKFLLFKNPVLCTGITGNGKTVIAKDVLKRFYDSNEFVTASINFSAQTSSNRTQEIIESKLEKKKKNILGGPPGKRVIIFIDDINMPKLDPYGVQPTIELLRQFLDFGGIFDRKKLYWKSIVDVVLLAACGPQGGGRNPLSPRFLRHLAVLNIRATTEETMKHIFSSALKVYFANFTSTIQEMTEPIVGAAIDIYAFVCRRFLPTPEKSHYVYNLRDLSRCFQGILQASAASIREKDQMLRLFYHENLRVLHDRLMKIEDQKVFYYKMNEILENHFFGITLPVIEDNEGNFKKPWLLFGDFLNPSVGYTERLYEEITDAIKLKTTLEGYLDEYNANSKTKMNFVFFLDALEHVARIARILRLERGNALLIGARGIGKQSLTKLGAHLCGFKFFTIKLTRGYDHNAFHEDLRKLYKNIGLKNEKTVFLFMDNQIVLEEFLEDINNMLNSGEVPHLFEDDEYEQVIQGARSAAKEYGIAEGNRDAIFEYFMQSVRKNLHLVICMSPVINTFRSRCYTFPSIINSCTINWFYDWPRDALLSVANNYLETVKNEELRRKLGSTCVFIHEEVSNAAELFSIETKRIYHVNPGSYLEFISLYLSMLSDKTEEIRRQRDCVQNGMIKLKETYELSAKMKVELIALEPNLNKKNTATEILMKNLAKEQSEADRIRKVVINEEAVVKIKAEETQNIAADAQKELDEALPSMEDALKALNSLDKNDIKEVCAFIKPPNLVKYVMEAVCLLLGVKTDWASAKILLSDMNFLKILQEYDKDNISDPLLWKLKEYVDNPIFIPDLVESQSKACKYFCMWVRAIDFYAKVYRIVQPKRKRLQAAEEELNQVMTVLREKQKKLAEAEAQISQLEAAYDASMAEKLELERMIELTTTRLHRAGRLIIALGDEETRWGQMVKNFEMQLENVAGNVLISAAFVAYLGAFTANYRSKIIEAWIKELSDVGISVSKDYSIIDILADQFEIQHWNICGLPRDTVSIENGILVTHTRKWPLMIDPQEKARAWIEQLEAENNLQRVRSTTPNLFTILQKCINDGIPVLLEVVDEVLEPYVETLVQKNTFIQAGRKFIHLCGKDIEYNENFRFYMITKLSNPSFLSINCNEVTIVNFTVTQSGLDEQLLSDTVQLKNSDLETEWVELIARINEDKKQLKEIEEKILNLLFKNEGNMLDNEELVDILNESKDIATIIATKLQLSESKQEKILAVREEYRPVSVRGSLIYIAMSKLVNIDHMYQFSYKHFNQVFKSVIDSGKMSQNLHEPLEVLPREITKSIYNNISKGLFERHKLVFSFLLSIEILMNSGEITSEGVDFLLRGSLSTNQQNLPKIPESYTITKSMWENVNFLENNFKNFTGLTKYLEGEIKINIGDFQQVIQISSNKTDKSAVDWNEYLGDFDKLLLIKAMKEEKLIFGITEFVKEKLGYAFLENPPVNLHELYQVTSNTTPLLFLLTTGSDPFKSMQHFAEEMGYQDKIHCVSLGQGQGPKAAKLINIAVMKGEWVFLQNCHLDTYWMAEMEKIVLKIIEEPEKVHGNFRLYLSTMPFASFPVFVLQNSVKVSLEAPSGLKAYLTRTVAELDENFFKDNVLQEKWRKLVFGICFFHVFIQESKKFGPFSWNIPYDFSNVDREYALGNLRNLCAEGDIPWDTLEFITGDIIYGGRVTDFWDQRRLKIVLKLFLSPQILNEGYKYSYLGKYYNPEMEKLDEFKDSVLQFPIFEQTEVFRMQANASFIYEKNETQEITRTLRELQLSRIPNYLRIPSDENICGMILDIRKELVNFIEIKNFHQDMMQHDSEDRLLSLATVVVQEVENFNTLLNVIHKSLTELQNAIKGLGEMSEPLEEMYNSLTHNQIPKIWTEAAYPSVKGLGGWIADLRLRLNFIITWLNTGCPISFWLPGFFFPQRFITAILQTHSRRNALPADQLTFTFKIKQVILNQEEIDKLQQRKMCETKTIYCNLERPQEGVLIHGLYLHAAGWDLNGGLLTDPLSGELNPAFPVMHIVPKETVFVDENSKKYICPMYKTPQQAGILSTSGQSTNFIMAVLLPTIRPDSYWIIQGTALIAQNAEQ